LGQEHEKIVSLVIWPACVTRSWSRSATHSGCRSRRRRDTVVIIR